MAIFVGTSENDRFNGDSDSDSVILAGNAAGYAVHWVDGRVKLVDIDASDGDTGIDTLTGIEILSFADRDYAVATQMIEIPGAVYLYNEILDRQYDPITTALPDGGYLATWSGPGNESSATWNIYAQRYDEDGAAMGSKVLINTHKAGNQRFPETTVLSDGGYVIAWISDNQDGSSYGVYAQRFDAAGHAVGSETRVNTTAIGSQNDNKTLALKDGGYLISWKSSQPGAETSLCFQRFDADGNAVGNETLVNLTNVNWQSDPVIAALENGGYAVAWRQSGLGSAQIYTQLLDADGNPVGAEVKVNGDLLEGHQTEPAIAALANGGYVISWSSEEGGDIYVRLFGADGQPVGSPNRLTNFEFDGYQRDSQVTALEDGGYVVAWASESGDSNNTNAVYAQRFDANGHEEGGKTLVGRTAGTGSVFYLNIEGLSDGGYFISWHFASFSGDNLGRIIAQRFDADGQKVASGLEVTGTDQADTLTGGQGTQILIGKAGADVLAGKAGYDVLIGGGGKDVFVFDTKPVNADKIVGFTSADAIHLDNAIFTALGGAGVLGASKFVANTTGYAADANDYIVYETDTGKLFYDADGNGGGARVQIALLGNQAALTVADIVVI